MKKYVFFQIILGAICLLFPALMIPASAQENPEPKPFRITIERKNNEVKLICTKGCAWKDLSFTLTPGSPAQAVDESGMVSVNGNKEDVSVNPAFLFTVEATASGFNLKGLKGTSWTGLKFNCVATNCFQVFDQNGMRSSKMAYPRKSSGEVTGEW